MARKDRPKLVNLSASKDSVIYAELIPMSESECPRWLKEISPQKWTRVRFVLPGREPTPGKNGRRKPSRRKRNTK